MELTLKVTPSNAIPANLLERFIALAKSKGKEPTAYLGELIAKAVSQAVTHKTNPRKGGGAK